MTKPNPPPLDGRTTAEVKVLAAIYDHLEDGARACLVADLAVETGYTPRHVARALRSLRADKLITVEGPRGGGLPNIYRPGKRWTR